MNYFQYTFKFENALVDYAREIFERNHDPLTSFGVVAKQLPDALLQCMNKEFASLGIDLIQYIHFWRKPANHHQPIHVDPWDWDVAGGFSDKIVPTHVAINIPITTSVDTSMFWYEGDHELQYKTTQVKSKEVRLFNIKWFDDPKMSDELIFNRTHIVRVHTPHNVIIGDQSRDLISLRLKSNPTFDRVVARLKDRSL